MAIKQLGVIASSLLCKIQNLSSNLPKEVDQIAPHSLNPKFVVGFNLHQIVFHKMDRSMLQAYANPIYQSFGVKDHGFSSSDISTTYPRESTFPWSETESFNTVIILLIVVETTNLEKQLTSIKATLEMLTKKSREEDAQMKHQSEQMASPSQKSNHLNPLRRSV